MTTIDLDAAARARQEAKQEPHEFIFRGKTFTLPAELELEAGELIDSGKFREGYGRLLNGQAEEFFSLAPTFSDLRELGTQLAALYAGLLQGESQASRSSSKNDSTSSRRPSRRTTKST